MSYIGSTPANKLVTSSDMEDGIVTTAKIANDAATADKIANAVNSAITANTAKTGISSAQTSAITANTSKTTNATHSGEVTGSGALTIADNIVDEANLKVSNSPTNGYNLVARSGNTGGMTWETPAGGSNLIPSFSAYRNGGQNINDNTATKVAFDAEVYDEGGVYDASSNFRFTPAVAGKYYIQSSLSIGLVSGGDRMEAKIYKNGSLGGPSSVHEFLSDTVRDGTAYVTGILILDDNDYIEIYVIADAGGQASINATGSGQIRSSFEAFKLI